MPIAPPRSLAAVPFFPRLRSGSAAMPDSRKSVARLPSARRSSGGPRRLSQRKKATRTRSTKTAVGEIVEKRAKAYAEIEPHLCAVVNLGTIASNLFDCTDRGPSPRGDAGHLKARYYALDFQPWSAGADRQGGATASGSPHTRRLRR